MNIYELRVFVTLILLIGIAVPGCESNTKKEEIRETENIVTSSEPMIDLPINANAYPTIAEIVPAIESLVDFAQSTGWEIKVGGEGPKNYQSLLDTGVLSVIFKNRYSGTDIAVSQNYSVGDFYLQYPTKEIPEYHFWIHNGEFDYAWDSEMAYKGIKHRVKQCLPNYECSFDGRTLFKDSIVDPSLLTPTSPSGARKRYNIPEDDNARSHMFILAYEIQNLMNQYPKIIQTPLSSHDDCIELFGRKNSVSWTNPYNGEPIKELPWENVTQYMWDNIYTDSNTQFDTEPNDPPDAYSLAGNYSFVGEKSIDGDRFVYVQFYFLLPDKKPAAYLVIADID